MIGTSEKIRKEEERCEGKRKEKNREEEVGNGRGRERK